MPTRAYSAAELDEAAMLLDVAGALDSEDEDEAEVKELLILGACEPAVKRLRQDIGPEKLSIARLRREAADRGITGDDVSRNIYCKYGFYLDELQVVCRVLSPGDNFETIGGHHLLSISPLVTYPKP